MGFILPECCLVVVEIILHEQQYVLICLIINTGSDQ